MADGFTYEDGVVSLRTGGLDPNVEPLSVGDRSRVDGLTIGAPDVTVEGLHFRTCRNKGIQLLEGADNVDIRQNLFVGAHVGIDCGSNSIVDAPRIEKNAYSGYPLYRQSVYPTTRQAEQTLWSTIYDTEIPGADRFGNSNIGFGMTLLACGGSGAVVTDNLTYRCVENLPASVPGHQRRRACREVPHDQRQWTGVSDQVRVVHRVEAALAAEGDA